MAQRLTISKSLINLLGGELKLFSKFGQGSDFVFRIPFDATEAITGIRDEESHHSAETLERDWTDKTILIAEDIESNYIYLQEILRPSGMNLLWAKNGKEAVDYAMKNPEIEMVLMDILMPEMDGYEAAERIKKLRPDLPIIAQTAYNLNSDRGKEELAYFDEFLIKPIWSHNLITVLEKHIQLSR